MPGGRGRSDSEAEEASREPEAVIGAVLGAGKVGDGHGGQRERSRGSSPSEAEGVLHRPGGWVTRAGRILLRRPWRPKEAERTSWRLARKQTEAEEGARAAEGGARATVLGDFAGRVLLGRAEGAGGAQGGGRTIEAPIWKLSIRRPRQRSKKTEAPTWLLSREGMADLKPTRTPGIGRAWSGSTKMAESIRGQGSLVGSFAQSGASPGGMLGGREASIAVGRGLSGPVMPVPTVTSTGEGSVATGERRSVLSPHPLGSSGRREG